MDFVATFCSSLGTEKVYENEQDQDGDTEQEVDIEHSLVRRILIHLLEVSLIKLIKVK